MYTTRRDVLAVLSGVTVGLAGCIGDDDPTPTPVPTDVAAEIEVHAVTFEPDFVEIEPGDTVLFEHVTGQHTITLFHAENGVQNRSPAAVNGVFDISIAEGTREVKFESEGVHDIFCRPHEGVGMAATVIVGEPTVDEPGLSEPAQELPGSMREQLHSLNAMTRQRFDLEDGGSFDITPAEIDQLGSSV